MRQVTDRRLTADDRGRLLMFRDARIAWGFATLRAVEHSFVMSGPSGTHSLLISATDAERLDAHWQGFCADRRNQPAPDRTGRPVAHLRDYCPREGSDIGHLPD